jgi:hypothetical protein
MELDNTVWKARKCVEITCVVGNLKSVSHIDFKCFQIVRQIYLNLLRCLVITNQDKGFEGHFGRHEAIGLKLDGKNKHIYITDLGGMVYRINTVALIRRKSMIQNLSSQALTYRTFKLQFER